MNIYTTKKDELVQVMTLVNDLEDIEYAIRCNKEPDRILHAFFTLIVSPRRYMRKLGQDVDPNLILSADFRASLYEAITEFFSTENDTDRRNWYQDRFWITGHIFDAIEKEETTYPLNRIAEDVVGLIANRQKELFSKYDLSLDKDPIKPILE